MTQYDPPPQIAEFNYIWQRWLNSLFILVKGSVQKDSSGNITIGTGGTGATNARLILNGGSASGGSAQIRLQRNNVSSGYLMTTGEWLSNNDSDLGLISESTYNIKFFTNGLGTARLIIDTSGNVLVTSPSGLGYGTGAGGTVTQITSRTTGVTINKSCGGITLFTAAGSATPATFTVSNSLIAATDLPRVCCKSSTNVYITNVTAVVAGSFNITFWTTGGTSSDTPVFTFDLGRAVTS